MLWIIILTHSLHDKLPLYRSYVTDLIKKKKQGGVSAWQRICVSARARVIKRGGGCHVKSSRLLTPSPLPVILGDVSHTKLLKQAAPRHWADSRKLLGSEHHRPTGCFVLSQGKPKTETGQTERSESAVCVCVFVNWLTCDHSAHRVPHREPRAVILAAGTCEGTCGRGQRRIA